jgi:hypothetical protein
VLSLVNAEVEPLVLAFEMEAPVLLEVLCLISAGQGHGPGVPGVTAAGRAVRRRAAGR